MAPLVRTGGSHHTGLTAPLHRNIHRTRMNILVQGFRCSCEWRCKTAQNIPISHLARRYCQVETHQTAKSTIAHEAIKNILRHSLYFYCFTIKVECPISKHSTKSYHKRILKHTRILILREETVLWAAHLF